MRVHPPVKIRARSIRDTRIVGQTTAASARASTRASAAKAIAGPWAVRGRLFKQVAQIPRRCQNGDIRVGTVRQRGEARRPADRCDLRKESRQAEKRPMPDPAKSLAHEHRGVQPGRQPPQRTCTGRRGAARLSAPE